MNYFFSISKIQRLCNKAQNSLHYTLTFALLVCAHFSSNACSPLNIPTLLNQSIVGTNLILDFQSNTTYQCNGYYIQVEIVCNNGNFLGVAPFFAGPSINKTATPFSYPSQTISLTSLCAGTTYKFRAREVYPTSTFSGWTQTYTFTTAGVFVQPTLNLSSTSLFICPPQTVTLSANISNGCGNPAQYSYAWTPTTGLSSATVQSPVVSPTNNVTYNCVVTGGPLGCWTATNSITLSLSTASPIVGQAVAAPANFCVGKTTTLSVSTSSGNIQWQSGPTNTGPWTNIGGAVFSPFATPPLTSNTCFQAVISTCSGTITSNAICITTNSVPVLTPSVLQSNCSNTNAVVSFTNPGTSGAPSSVTWAPVPISVGSGSTSATYSFVGQTSITVAFPDGCVSNTVVSINPPPPIPNFSFSSGSPVITCSSPTVNLSAVSSYSYGSLNYYWSGNNATFSTSAVSITSASPFTVTVTDPNTFCSTTKTISITSNTVAPTSVISPTYQNITCSITSAVNLTANVTSPTVNIRQIIYSPLGGSYSVSSTQLFYPLTTPGTYTHCTINDINGCSTCKQFTVASNQGFPTFSVVSPQNFTIGCGVTGSAVVNITNGATTPTAGGAISYTMLSSSSSTGYGTGTLSSFTTSIPGTYTLVTKDNSSLCESKLVISIISNTLGPKLDTLIVPTNIIDCANPTVVLQGISSTPNITYNWSFPGATGNLPSSSISVYNNTLAPTATLVANYTLTITDNNNTCKTTTTVPILQNKYPPFAKISNGGVGALSCKIPTLTLTNVSSTGIPANSIFINSGPVIASRWDGPTPQQPAFNTSTYFGSTVGDYTLTAMDSNNGCISTTVITIGDNKIYPKVNDPEAPADFILDCGAGTTSISPIITSPLDVLSYQWNVPPGAAINGANSKIAIVDMVGDYQIIVTNTVTGCAVSAFVNVVNGVLHGGFTPDKTDGYAPLTVNITNDSKTTAGSNSVTTAWNFGNGTNSLTTSALVSPLVVFNEPGTYTVMAFVSKGPCLDTIIKLIRVEIPSQLEIPNVFTPNGDNVNDIFFLKTANLTKIDIKIFDRWGHKVYDLVSDKGNIAWDGKNQYGKDVADGTYYYILKATGADGRSFETKGTVSLFR